MKKRRSRKVEIGEMAIDMTPMIDCVFQLLIFFVLTNKFIEQEGELRSYLPKNRGLQPTVATSVDLANVTIFLGWEGDSETGRCVAITTNYQPASGGNQQRYQFPNVAGGSLGYAANKEERIQYSYPDFNEVKDYVRYRKDNYSGIGVGLPVTVNFTDKVPWQMVVNVVDICVDLGITDFALNATGVD
jgi:hypothetical protein